MNGGLADTTLSQRDLSHANLDHSELSQPNLAHGGLVQSNVPPIVQGTLNPLPLQQVDQFPSLTTSEMFINSLPCKLLFLLICFLSQFGVYITFLRNVLLQELSALLFCI